MSNAMSNAARWYPLKLTFHVRAYQFGERLIPEVLGKRGVPDTGVVAETWEISDAEGTTGTVSNGAFSGTSLRDLTRQNPDELVGRGWRGPYFPLLAKFLDASHMLPVHLHADDATAARKYGEPNGKTEAWHILECADNATILAGIKPGVTDADLRAALWEQRWDDVMPRYPISPGETIYVPGGVLHAFGPDTLIFEIQQTSDLAQHVMPNDLYGNALSDAERRRNVDETLDELRWDFLPQPNHGLTRYEGDVRIVVGCAGPHFALERWNFAVPFQVSGRPDRCLTLTNLGDPIQIAYHGGVEALGRARSCILPAALGDVTLVPDGRAVALACFVPDLERDIVQPLRDAGHAERDIQSLGEW